MLPFPVAWWERASYHRLWDFQKYNPGQKKSNAIEEGQPAIAWTQNFVSPGQNTSGEYKREISCLDQWSTGISTTPTSGTVLIEKRADPSPLRQGRYFEIPAYGADSAQSSQETGGEGILLSENISDTTTKCLYFPYTTGFTPPMSHIPQFPNLVVGSMGFETGSG